MKVLRTERPVHPVGVDTAVTVASVKHESLRRVIDRDRIARHAPFNLEIWIFWVDADREFV